MYFGGAFKLNPPPAKMWIEIKQLKFNQLKGSNPFVFFHQNISWDRIDDSNGHLTRDKCISPKRRHTIVDGIEV